MMRFNQPQGFYTVTFNEVLDRFSFYGITSMLVLSMTINFNFTDKEAYALYGTFMTLVFLTPAIGGYFADRYFNHFHSVMIGLALIILGNFMFITGNLQSTFFGLSLLICGIGLLKSNNASLLGFLYTNEDKHRESGFTLYYMGMNVGAILGPLAYGFITLKYGKEYSYLSGILGVGFMLFLAFKKYRFFYETEAIQMNLVRNKSLTKSFFIAIGLIFTVYLIDMLLKNNQFFEIFLVLIGIAVVTVLTRIVLSETPQARRNMLFLFALYGFGIFFFACSSQLTGFMMLFVNANLINNHLSHKIPTEIFASLEPLSIIIIAPVIARIMQMLKKIKEKDLIILSVGLSLIMVTIGFIFFKVSADHVDSFAIFLSMIILGNLFVGIGELFLAPTLMSAVAYLIDKKFQGTFMGLWPLSVALSGFFGSLIAQATATTSASADVFDTFSNAFKLIVILMVIVIVVYAFMVPFLRKLAHR